MHNISERYGNDQFTVFYAVLSNISLVIYRSSWPILLKRFWWQIFTYFHYVFCLLTLFQGLINITHQIKVHIFAHYQRQMRSVINSPQCSKLSKIASRCATGSMDSIDIKWQFLNILGKHTNFMGHSFSDPRVAICEKSPRNNRGESC